MIKLTIDNMPAEVEAGTTILQAVKKLGLHVPHFCYHKRLSIAGNCRMCLVEVEGAKNLSISCKDLVREGMVVKTASEPVLRARKDVLEFILINHPVDCPTCDQSGECKLQDYFFDYSLRPSRLVDGKVHKPKVKPIGPHIILDAERCIECTRCIRFCEEIVGVHEIGLFDRGDHSTIDVVPGKELSNPYSLCTVDLCPVGALTSKDFRFKKRVWFLTSTPSICTGCATGCNIWIDHADSIVYRYRPRENEEVNKSWMCDAGRMTYKQLLAQERVLRPMVEGELGLVEVAWEVAIERMASYLAAPPAAGIAGVLSARSSVEENEAFALFCREIFQTQSLCWSGAESDPAFADEILRDAERSPNKKTAQGMSTTSWEQLKTGMGFFVLDGLSRDDLLKVIELKPAWIILIASQRPPNPKWLNLLLPKATHAEQAGTFINRNGRAQKTEEAFSPLGESATVWEIAGRIAKRMGKTLQPLNRDPLSLEGRGLGRG